MLSDVARLRQQIELECQAMQRVFTEFAIVASHEVVSHKYHALDQCRVELAQHVGEEQALTDVIETYNRVVVGETKS